jgi:DNA-binding transcriptional ArsR family regulator
MKLSFAIDSLAALAQETRLSIFRLLVQHAPAGLPAGTIARRLKLPGPTLSFHLNVLAAAELIRPFKSGRSITYTANFDTFHRLTSYLMENCCGGAVNSAPSKGSADKERTWKSKM